MRKLFLFIAAVMCAASMTLNVHAEVLTFDFEGDDPTIPAEWVNDETYPWTVVNDAPEGFGGVYCIACGNSGVSSSSSTLEATFTFIGDGSISFDAGCWGEGATTYWDQCSFYMDDVLKFSAGASQDWQNVSIEVSAGTHTFRWEYKKDGSVNPTIDVFYVDNIVVDLGVLPPTVEEDGWVHYDNGEYHDAIGLGSGAAFSWGIKIPAGTVTDTYLTKVSLYINVAANATVSIYQGGPTPYEATLLHTQDVIFTQTGVIEVINLMPSVQIDPTQDTWIVFNSPGYAASYSVLENAVNGRWIEHEGAWDDIAVVTDGYYVNLAWMIRGLFASEPEYHPYVINLNASDITSNSANLAWEGLGEAYEVRYKKHNPTINNTFQDEDLGDWTTIDADGDGYTWVFRDVDLGTGIGSASYINNIGSLNPDNYLVSPKFVIGDSITFEAIGLDKNDFQEHFGVAVSTTSNTDPAAFTTIWEETLDEDAKQTWKKFTIDLSAYKGQMCYVAIRHFDCTNQFWMLVRNVTFYPNHDPEPDPEWTVVRNLNEAAYALSQLEPYSEYWVEVKAFYGDELTDWSKTYKFYTLEEETGIESIVESRESKVDSRKILHEGNLYILRDGKIFNAQGARVR